MSQDEKNAVPSPSKVAKLLVVDDNENNRDMLSRRLRRRGYEVVLAEDGQQALDLIEVESFDLVLLDIMMPGVNGTEVLQTVRETRDAYSLPIIMVTANAQSEDVVGSLKLGANDYVTKPIDFPVLHARLKTHLGLKQATEDLDDAYQRMKIDLAAAAAVQRTLLPSTLPSTPGADIEWRYVPCDELAGDILNIIRLDEQHLGVYVLDVSGHGVQAALLSSALSHVLSPNGAVVRERAPDTGEWIVTPPAEVARRLNVRFPMNDSTLQYFTMIYGVLNLEEMAFKFICAGHPGPVCLLSGSDPETVQPKGYPIGIHKDPECVERTLQLQSGDRFYLFTDGVIEAMDASYEEFAYPRLLECLQRVRPLDLRSGLDDTIQTLEQWVGSTFQDDITILGLEVK